MRTLRLVSRALGSHSLSAKWTAAALNVWRRFKCFFLVHGCTVTVIDIQYSRFTVLKFQEIFSSTNPTYIVVGNGGEEPEISSVP